MFSLILRLEVYNKKIEDETQKKKPILEVILQKRIHFAQGRSKKKKSTNSVEKKEYNFVFL